MRFATYEQAIAEEAGADGLAAYVIDVVGRLSDGEDVTIDFLDRAAVGAFCTAMRFGASRNWAALGLDEISPVDQTGARVVPADEASAVLAAVKVMFGRRDLVPHDEGTPARHILNDFLPPGRYRGRRTLGHLWEWQYALAVELEHGRYRGTNVTNNHPLLTALVVLAHLSEDRLYYPRLWVMESEGELFNAELAGAPKAQIKEAVTVLSRARSYLAERVAEHVALA